MAIERERKFLVNTELWKPTLSGIRIVQGYLSQDYQRIVRVRIADKQAFLTVKGKNRGICRDEFEYEIPLSDGENLLKLCYQPVVEKMRYNEVFAGALWEVDCFSGVNMGLVVAEIELDDESMPISLPPWIGQEVSDDPRYYNSNLIDKPYSTW